MERIEATRFTSLLERGVTLLQSVVAAFLAVLFLLGFWVVHREIEESD